MVLITIIVPTYNSSETISRCLESIFNQTFTDFEIIIVDGLSSDQTIEISKSFNSSRIKITSEIDNGIYDAMNKGVRLAKGEWIYFLGSDDIFYNNLALESISKVLKVTKNKIIYGNVLVKGNTGWAMDQTIYDGEFTLKKLVQKNICHQAILYKKDLLRNYSFNTSFNICADYDLNLNLFSKYKFQYVDLIIAIFNSGGESTLKKDLHFQHTESIIKYFYLFLHRNEFYSLRNQIREHADKTNNLLKKVYLNAVYIKHKYIAHSD